MLAHQTLLPSPLLPPSPDALPRLVHPPRAACHPRSVGKILRLRQKITSIKDSVTGLFKGGASKDTSSQKLDAFKGGRAPCLPAGLGGLGLLLAAEGLLALGGS